MLASFTLGLLIAILIVQAGITLVIKRIADNAITTGALVNAALQKQNEIQHELTQRVALLEKRVNALTRVN
jgi:hypothetical protein